MYKNTDNGYELEQKNLLLIVTATEVVLLLVALLWGFLAEINPFNCLSFDLKDIFIGIIGAMLLLAVNFLSINVFSKYIPFFKHLKNAYSEVCALCTDISLQNAFIMAVLSGFVEELFFRGILQPQFGIIISSIVFGFFHIGGKKTFYYGIYTIFIGLYLGWLFIFTGNLLTCVIVHFLNNFLAFPYMRYYYKKYIKGQLD